MWLVVGLGNPGREYERHRHNVGFLIADLLAYRLGARFGRHRRSNADVAEARLGLGLDAPQLVLVKPMTYMNLSGGPVAGLARFYKVDPAQIIVQDPAPPPESAELVSKHGIERREQGACRSDPSWQRPRYSQNSGNVSASGRSFANSFDDSQRLAAGATLSGCAGCGPLLRGGPAESNPADGDRGNRRWL